MNSIYCVEKKFTFLYVVCIYARGNKLGNKI